MHPLIITVIALTAWAALSIPTGLLAGRALRRKNR